LYIDGKPIEFPSSQIYDITEDPLGRLWIATWGDGLFVVRLEADGLLNITHLMKRSYNESLIRIIRADNRHHYWLATNNGVYHIDMLKKTLTDDDFISHNIQHGDFPFDEISCLMPDSAGNIWVGGLVVACRSAATRMASSAFSRATPPTTV
jgi:ligand-binding sensor domain-containing protein